jgi:transcription elongation factor S-II
MQTTKAGIIVAKQRLNQDKQIARLASEIVSKWKTAVEAEKKKKAKMSSPAPNGAASSPAPAPTSSAGFTGDPAKRTRLADKVETDRTQSKVRNACIALIYDGLAFMSTESSTHILNVAIDVERAAFKNYNGENNEYRGKIRSLFQNLKNKSNRELSPRVLSGEIPPEKFVVMNHEELKSAKQKEVEDKLQQENMKNAQVPMAEKSVSDALRCGKCQQKKVSYSQAQTRSADEPMTTFCECLNCGNRWKVSLLRLCVQPRQRHTNYVIVLLG